MLVVVAVRQVVEEVEEVEEDVLQKNPQQKNQEGPEDKKMNGKRTPRNKSFRGVLNLILYFKYDNLKNILFN